MKDENKRPRFGQRLVNATKQVAEWSKGEGELTVTRMDDDGNILSSGKEQVSPETVREKVTV